MQITAEEMMKLMLNFFNNTDQDLKEEREKLGNVDSQMSDLDHYLEAHTLKAGELAKIAKERQRLCRERRQIKNNISLINILKKFVDKWKQKLITGDIIQKLKEYTQEIHKDRPQYVVVNEKGPQHKKVFEVEVHYRGEVLASGTGLSKKDAEQKAAYTACKSLGVI